MENDTRDLETRIELIEERNRRVEADKAWETSAFRIGTLTIITYLIAGAVMAVIHVSRPFVNALIPAIGFFLSIQTLPLLKKWWIKKYLKKGGAR